MLIDEKLLGRIAFVVSNSHGSLSLEASVDSCVLEAESEWDDGFFPPENTSNGIKGRPGVNVNEIWLGSLDLFNGEQLTKLSSESAAGGEMPLGGWSGKDKLFAALGVTTSADENSILKYFSFNTPEDKEAFWKEDTDSDGIKDNNELYHRFNITRNDWNGLLISDIIKEPVIFKVEPKTNTEINTGGIYWLSNWKEGSKKQIAANFIDYCDSNSTATSDYLDINKDGVEDSGDNFSPTYVGLDKSPYINEVKLEVQGYVREPVKDGLWSGGNMKVSGSSVNIPSGHSNGSINLSYNYLNHYIAPSYMTYITSTNKTIVNDPWGALKFRATKVNTPARPPTLPKMLDWYKAQDNAHVYNESIKLYSAMNGGIDVHKALNNDLIENVDNDSIIYVTNGNIETSNQGGFNKIVTLISETGDVKINGGTSNNVELNPAVEKTTIYAAGTVTANGTYAVIYGYTKAIGDININATYLNYGSNWNTKKAAFWSDNDLTISGVHLNVLGIDPEDTYTCNVAINDIKLELVNMYKITEAMDCVAEVSVEGSYDWNIGNKIITANFDRTFQLDVAAEAKSENDVVGYFNNESFIQDLVDHPERSTDISPDPNTSNVAGGLSTSIDSFKITKLNIKLMNASKNLLDYSDIDSYPGKIISDNLGFEVEGELNINPGNTFVMQTPAGQYDVGDIKAWKSNIEYNGSANEVTVKPKSSDKSITINGTVIDLSPSNPYTFTGNMTVRVWNEKNSSSKSWGQATGQWWINISGSGIAINPEPAGIPELHLSPEEMEKEYTTVTDDGMDKSLLLDHEIADPRQNLNKTDWQVMRYRNVDNSSETAEDDKNYVGTIGSTNKELIDILKLEDLNRDPEPATKPDPDDPQKEIPIDPWDISTAYIRNAPMESPWELGAIHRGKAGQTLNLKKYNSSEGLAGGGNDYLDGDANIFDQIKMTNSTTTLGKINLNETEPYILRTLFHGISVGSGYDNPGTKTLKTIDITRADKLDHTDFLRTDSTGPTSDPVPKKFDTRSQAVNITTTCISMPAWIESESTLPTKMPYETDALQEEIVGKFINLTKADNLTSNQLIIIAVAQTIKDIGGVDIKRDLNWDGKIDAVEETFKDTKFGVYDQNADQITATQKMLIKLHKTTEGKYKIRRFEYIND